MLIVKSRLTFQKKKTKKQKQKQKLNCEFVIQAGAPNTAVLDLQQFKINKMERKKVKIRMLF